MNVNKPAKGTVLRSKRGQSIIELTLLAPVLLVALYIPADFGISIFAAHLAQNAVREGARIGSIDPSAASNAGTCTLPCSSKPSGSALRETADRMPVSLIPSAQITAEFANGTGCMKMVRVTVTGNYNFFLYQLMRIIGLPAPDSLPITRAAAMRYELQPVGNGTPCPYS